MPSGSCACGNIQYEVDGDPQASILCHCADCRKIGGASYSANSIYKGDSFKVTKGTPKEWTKEADGGNNVTSHFCGDCGSTMWRSGKSFGANKAVKAGTLDDTNIIDHFKADTELYAGNRPEWVKEQSGADQKKGMS